MEFLKKLVRFVLMQIAALGFMLVAPLLYLIPFVLVVLTPNNGIFPMLAAAYMVTGPFVSAFWTMIVCMMRRVRRVRNGGGTYTPSVQGMFAATGWMLYGFFGTLAAELLFCFLFGVPTYTPDVAVNAAKWNLWFAGAGFAVFSPIFLLLARRLLLKSSFRTTGGV